MAAPGSTLLAALSTAIRSKFIDGIPETVLTEVEEALESEDQNAVEAYRTSVVTAMDKCAMILSDKNFGMELLIQPKFESFLTWFSNFTTILSDERARNSVLKLVKQALDCAVKGAKTEDTESPSLNFMFEMYKRTPSLRPFLRELFGDFIIRFIMSASTEKAETSLLMSFYKVTVGLQNPAELTRMQAFSAKTKAEARIVSFMLKFFLSVLKGLKNVAEDAKTRSSFLSLCSLLMGLHQPSGMIDEVTPLIQLYHFPLVLCVTEAASIADKLGLKLSNDGLLVSEALVESIIDAWPTGKRANTPKVSYSCLILRAVSRLCV